jgi:hypothetical protein
VSMSVSIGRRYARRARADRIVLAHEVSSTLPGLAR